MPYIPLKVPTQVRLAGELGGGGDRLLCLWCCFVLGSLQSEAVGRRYGPGGVLVGVERWCDGRHANRNTEWSAYPGTASWWWSRGRQTDRKSTRLNSSY